MNRAAAVSLAALALLLTLSHADKITVAVMSLKNASGVTADDAELLSDRLRIELFNTNVFAVMERSQMQDILKEHAFQMSGACNDEGCMIEMGQILGVETLIGGSIGKLGDMFLVNLRAIDIRSGRISAVVSEDISGSIEKVVKLLPSIAARLAAASTKGSQPKVIAITTPPPVPSPPEPLASPAPPEPVSSDPRTPPPPLPVESSPLPHCDSKVYLEIPEFTMQQIGADSLSSEEMQRLNEDIANELEGPLDECLFNDVEIATRGQIAAMSGCNSLVIRLALENYTTEPGTREQFKGTATVAFAYYEGVNSATPFHIERYTETGAQHWGEYEPFQNVFEEIAESIEDQDMGPVFRDVRARIRKL